MRDFSCPHCGQRLAFENSRCLGCGHGVAFDLEARDFRLIADDEGDGESAGGLIDLLPESRHCANQEVAACNWLAAPDDVLCLSCRLTRTRPSDDDAKGLPEFARAESAKRRLVLELRELGLPIVGRREDPDGGLAFDLLSSVRERVITGHDNGVITLDLAESDDVHRERLRTSMAEPYRTLLGHFRHEIGHYYFDVLAEHGPAREEFEKLFGDPDSDYAQALERHYSQGAPTGWPAEYISSYATMHPAEDWAETFAHYLHIRDTLDTAAAFGFAPAGATLDRPLSGDPGFERMIDLWLPLAWSLNMVNRSMGHPDLYPFVLPAAVLGKMRLVHRLVATSG